MVTTGRRLGGRPAPHPQEQGGPGEEARRRVTVLFCDLVGSTTLSAELDPEELRELLGRYHAAAAGAVEGYGGRLHHTLGDGLMASWGFPQAHEDDAARAVHAGLALIEAVRAARTEVRVSAPIEVRVAVHTGLALVADTTLGGKREVANLIGETPNIASRLQDVADPGSAGDERCDRRSLYKGGSSPSPIGERLCAACRTGCGVHRVMRAADGDRLVGRA